MSSRPGKNDESLFFRKRVAARIYLSNSCRSYEREGTSWWVAAAIARMPFWRRT